MRSHSSAPFVMLDLVKMDTWKDKKKPIICSTCNASFSTKQDLKKHFARVHGGKKSIKCSICDASLKVDTWKHMLQQFIRGRSNSIVLMWSSFSLSGNLKKHIKNVHEAESIQAFNLQLQGQPLRIDIK